MLFYNTLINDGTTAWCVLDLGEGFPQLNVSLTSTLIKTLHTYWENSGRYSSAVLVDLYLSDKMSFKCIFYLRNLPNFD